MQCLRKIPEQQQVKLYFYLIKQERVKIKTRDLFSPHHSQGLSLSGFRKLLGGMFNKKLFKSIVQVILKNQEKSFPIKAGIQGDHYNYESVMYVCLSYVEQKGYK